MSGILTAALPPSPLSPSLFLLGCGWESLSYLIGPYIVSLLGRTQETQGSLLGTLGLEFLTTTLKSEIRSAEGIIVPKIVPSTNTQENCRGGGSSNAETINPTFLKLSPILSRERFLLPYVSSPRTNTDAPVNACPAERKPFPNAMLIARRLLLKCTLILPFCVGAPLLSSTPIVTGKPTRHRERHRTPVPSKPTPVGINIELGGKKYRYDGPGNVDLAGNCCSSQVSTKGSVHLFRHLPRFSSGYGC
jgi:hypothetical protein